MKSLLIGAQVLILSLGAFGQDQVGENGPGNNTIPASKVFVLSSANKIENKRKTWMTAAGHLIMCEKEQRIILSNDKSLTASKEEMDGSLCKLSDEKIRSRGMRAHGQGFRTENSFIISESDYTHTGNLFNRVAIRQSSTRARVVIQTVDMDGELEILDFWGVDVSKKDLIEFNFVEPTGL